MKFVPHLFWCCGTNCTENKPRKASINIEAKWGTDLRGNCAGAEIYGHHRFPIYLECGRPWPPPSLESLLLHDERKSHSPRLAQPKMMEHKNLRQTQLPPDIILLLCTCLSPDRLYSAFSRIFSRPAPPKLGDHYVPPTLHTKVTTSYIRLPWRVT